MQDIKHKYMKAKKDELKQKCIHSQGNASLASIVGTGISFILGDIKCVTSNSIDAGSYAKISREMLFKGIAGSLYEQM